MRINKSILSHRMYIFFHCHHGAAVVFLLLLLTAAGIFVAINPFDFDFSQITESIGAAFRSFTEKIEFLKSVSNSFILFKEGTGLWNTLCVAAFIGGAAGIIFTAVLQSKKGILSSVSLMFYSLWAFLAISLKQHMSENTLIFMGVFMLAAMIIFAVTIKLMDKEDILATIILCLIFCAGIGLFCAAFSVVYGALDRSKPDIQLIVKLITGAIISIFAVFQADIIFAIPGVSEVIDVVRDPLADMIGNEYTGSNCR